MSPSPHPPGRSRILITGPGGRVGPLILSYLREHFALRLLDAVPLRIDLVGDDEFVQADIQDLATDLAFGVFFGVSNNTGRFWDISNAERLLGYQPVDDAFKPRPESA